MDIKLQLRHLITLQKAETDIKRLEDELAGVDEKVTALDNRLTESQVRLDSATEEIKTLKKTCRELEREVQDGTDQVAKRKERLNLLKSNKEYQATLKEIDDLKKRVSEKEDRILEIYEELENAEGKNTEAKKELDIQTQKVAAEKQHVQEAAQKSKAELILRKKDRNEALEQMDLAFLGRFDNLRASPGALFIVPAKDAVCFGCHMNIPPQLYNELQRMDRLVQCPHCERIIYYQKDDPS